MPRERLDRGIPWLDRIKSVKIIMRDIRSDWVVKPYVRSLYGPCIKSRKRNEKGDGPYQTEEGVGSVGVPSKNIEKERKRVYKSRVSEGTGAMNLIMSGDRWKRNVEENKIKGNIFQSTRLYGIIYV